MKRTMMGMRIKRFLCVLTALLLAGCVSASAALTDAQGEAPAAEIGAEVILNKASADMSLLRDGRDDTFTSAKNAREFKMVFTIPEETPLASVYARLTSFPASAELWQKTGKRYVAVKTVKDPGAEFVLTLDEPLTGSLLLTLTYTSSARLQVNELRFYEAGALPASLHAWARTGTADILYAVPAYEDLDTARIAAWTAAGRSVSVAVMGGAPEDLPAAYDALWRAGVRRTPTFLGLKLPDADADEQAAAKAWPEAATKAQLVSLIRAQEAQVIAAGGQGELANVLLTRLTDAAASAPDSAYETESAAQTGLWVVTAAMKENDGALSALLNTWPERSYDALREACAAPFADAVHGDVNTIPWPDSRLESGFLSEGEFLWEDAENGLWAYASKTVAVTVVRYVQPEIPREWFVSNVKFDPASESFGQVLYPAARFDGQLTYPETLAQSAQLVFGINGDYYPYRVKHKANIGNIIRGRTLLHTYNASKMSAYPVLDTAALHDDGSMTVYGAGEVTSQELLDRGDVHDALSFGPYLARDGRLRVYAGSSWDAAEPRCAVGMAAPGHYKVITVEGRFKKGVGPAGVNLNQLAQLMYAQGVTDAINLDGGSTSVLIFMGKKLNRTASKSGAGETKPRNMHELFGVGTSGLVHTDMLDYAGE